MSHETGTYVKGEQTRLVATKSDAVQAVWDGFTRATVDSDAPYVELQAQAKALDIPANQSAKALSEAIATYVVDAKPAGSPAGDNPAAPETSDTPLV
jgi:hypothetical protein